VKNHHKDVILLKHWELINAMMVIFKVMVS